MILAAVGVAVPVTALSAPVIIGRAVIIPVDLKQPKGFLDRGIDDIGLLLGQSCSHGLSVLPFAGSCSYILAGMTGWLV